MRRIEEETAEGRTLRDCVAAAGNAAASMVKTRLAIFREELGVKAGIAAKGLAAAALSGVLAVGILLLLAALIAAIFTTLFHSLILGILAALALYAVAAGLFGWMAWRSLSRLRPGQFPATGAELSRDLDALRSALRPEQEPPAGAAETAEEPDSGQVEDLERRLRAGVE